MVNEGEFHLGHDPGHAAGGDLGTTHWAAPEAGQAHWGDDLGHGGTEHPGGHVGAGGHGGNVYGTPEADAHFYNRQTTGFTCAVVAQQGIINEFTGANVSEAELVYEATNCGLLTDHGTSPEDVGLLLEAHGVECHTARDAQMSDLTMELAQGHKVVVAVNAETLWSQDHPLHAFASQAANHAIWVTGVDNTDPAHPIVVVNDSGDPNGRGHEYDLNTFVKAWSASGFDYVSTDHAPPGLAARAEGFDESTGTFTGMVDFLSACVPGIVSYVASAAVGAVVGDFTGSVLAEAAGAVVSHKLIDKMLEHAAAPPHQAALPHDRMRALGSMERDRLFVEI